MGNNLIDKGWSKMEMTLNEEMPIQKGNRRRVILFLLIISILLGGLSYSIMSNQNESNLEMTTQSLYASSNSFETPDNLSQTNINSIDNISLLNAHSQNDIKSFNQLNHIEHQNNILKDRLLEIDVATSKTNEFVADNIGILNEHTLGQSAANYKLQQSQEVIDKFNREQFGIETSQISAIVNNVSAKEFNDQVLSNALQTKINKNIKVVNNGNELGKQELIPNHQELDQLPINIKKAVLSQSNKKFASMPMAPVFFDNEKRNYFSLFAYTHSSSPIKLDGGGVGISYLINNNTIKPYVTLGIEYVKAQENVVLNSVTKGRTVEEISEGAIFEDYNNYSLSSGSKTTLSTISPFINFGIRWQILPKVFIDNEFGVFYDISKLNKNALSFDDDILSNKLTNSYFTKSRFAFKTNYKLGYNISNRLSVNAGYQIALTPEFNFVTEGESDMKVRLNRFNLGMTYNL